MNLRVHCRRVEGKSFQIWRKVAKEGAFFRHALCSMLFAYINDLYGPNVPNHLSPNYSALNNHDARCGLNIKNMRSIN